MTLRLGQRLRHASFRKGRSSAFDPATISGLQVWLDADSLDATHNDGDDVSSWPSVAPATGGPYTSGEGPPHEPNFQVSQRNGHDAVHFPGTGLTSVSGMSANVKALFPTAATLFIVAEPLSDTTYNLYEAGNIDGHYNFSGGSYIGSFKVSRLVNTPPTGMPSTGWHKWTVRSSASGYIVRLDGAEIANVAADYSDGGAFDHRIGSSVFGSQLTGHVAEIIISSNALSDADILNIEAYLTTKYAL